MTNEMVLQGIELFAIIGVGVLIHVRYNDQQKQLNEVKVSLDLETEAIAVLETDVHRLQVQINDLAEEVQGDLAKLKKNRR